MIERKKTKTMCDNKIKGMKICTDKNKNLVSVNNVMCDKPNEQNLSNVHNKLCMDNDNSSNIFSSIDVNCINIESEECQFYDENMLNMLTGNVTAESEEQTNEIKMSRNLIPETCSGKNINGYKISDSKISFTCK
jgi:hypothetical protein